MAKTNKQLPVAILHLTQLQETLLLVITIDKTYYTSLQLIKTFIGDYNSNIINDYYNYRNYYQRQKQLHTVTTYKNHHECLKLTETIIKNIQSTIGIIGDYNLQTQYQ